MWNAMNRTCPWRLLVRLFVVLAVCCLLVVSPDTFAQESDDTLPLHEREPFDRITLQKADNFAKVEVFPIESIDSENPPAEVSGALRVRRLVDPPDLLFAVAGANISKLETFPQMLRAEARKLLGENSVDDAYYYIARLANEYPKMRGLKQLEESFYYKDAGYLFSRKRYDEALLSLNQVYRLNPNRAGLNRVLDRVLSQIIQAEFTNGNFRSVRAKLRFAKEKYGSATEATVAKWQQRLKSKASSEVGAAKQALAAGNPSLAFAALRRAKDAWQDLPEIERLRKSILARFPRLRAAVTQPYQIPADYDPLRHELNWATRRAASLLSRGIVDFKEFTVDGGVYESRIGNLKVASGRTKVELTLDDAYVSEANSLARLLLRRANPDAEDFSPRWAEYVKSVYVKDANQLEVTFTRPSLLPQSLLPRANASNELAADFRLGAADEKAIRIFERIDDSDTAKSGVNEIAETYYDDPGKATDALLAGEVDLIDRVYPADLANLKSQADLSLLQYRLPTVHCLVFNDREPLLRNATFRRGLLYGINRQEFVRTELNAGMSPPIAEVISGLAPIGMNFDDPLSYAYNRDIEPRKYDPALANVLLRLAVAQKKNQEEPKQEESKQGKVNPDESTAGEEANAEPSSEENGNDESTDGEQAVAVMPELVLAHTDSPVATAGCEAIVRDLRRIGVKVVLRKLESGRGWPADRGWDLLYVETTIEEPLADLPNLILNHGILGRHGGLLWHAARSLQEASDLAEARRQFSRMHQLTFSHTPLIPLWQVIEHTAVRSGISGIRKQPITLYRSIRDWRLAP